MVRRKIFLTVIFASSISGSILATASAADNAHQVALKVDQLLRAEVPSAAAPPARIDDQRFLRRVSLDLIGRIPTPEQLTAFALDPATDKRSKIVEKLLADPRYGQNWGRYWRDVIMFRKTETRQQFLVGIPLESYLAESLNSNTPWSHLATEFITASGPANENGECGLIVAQQGQPEEIAAEVSRIFLGVQLQCAQCHDHPTDRWKREQFHQLAAFFPRVASQPSRPMAAGGAPPGITVVVTDAEQRFGFRGPMNMRVRGTSEHHMSDLKDPSSQGTLMEPVFFATGEKLPTGTKDADRRGTLAKWITAQDNPFFAKAFVNRLWSELTGEGFYEPVDDMGPDRHATAPKTLDYLAGQFADSGYDIKWLFRVITATELYQLPGQPRRGPEDPPMQHNVAQRLRADVLFDNLFAVLEIPEQQPATGARPMGRFARGPRQGFAAIFGYDPSDRRDELTQSIPQALILMNSSGIQAYMRGNGNTMLARTLSEIHDDKALIQELYLKVLSREPTKSETTSCLQYTKELANRTEAFEDILWSLINSAEFLHRS
jgi:hypothetical protein